MPAASVDPYVFYNGNCEEALEFYRTALGAEIEMIMHFDETPEPIPDGILAPGFEKKVMHASFKIGDSLIMASDGCKPEDPSTIQNRAFSLALNVDTVDEARRLFDAIATAGGSVQMPLGPTFWSPAYGQATDPFGIEWMVMARPAE